jgi:hypothetical protein
VTRESEPVVLHAVSRHTAGALRSARGHLSKFALRLVVFGVLAFLLLRLVPTLAQALHNLERVSWLWLVAALALEHLVSSPQRIRVEPSDAILPSTIEVEDAEGERTLVRLQAAPALPTE